MTAWWLNRLKEPTNTGNDNRIIPDSLNMTKIKINGTDYEFPAGTNVLEACGKAGFSVPHFCYHPVLSIVGSCRMCKVEVTQGGHSRIDISCNLTVADGLEIRTDTPEVKKQQQMTLEYLLKNHPLDCPVCDDAGECKLQNYYMEFGKHDSRLHEQKFTKRKAFDLGQMIVLDSERCILCSRCVRFFEEVTHTNELGIFGMGSHEELMVCPGERVDNDYSGNIVDLCPVGALTDKDFRFKRRVWYLNSAVSICEQCSRGCNVRLDFDVDLFHERKKQILMKTHRTPTTAFQRIQRIKPGENDSVNGHWMCNHGRYGYKSTDSEDRLENPLVRKEDSLEQVDLLEAVKMMANGIVDSLHNGKGKIAVIASPRLTNEELFAVWTLFREHLSVINLDHNLPIPSEWYGDDLLRTPDPFPNRMGCEWIGVEPSGRGVGISRLSEAIMSGKIDAVLSILADPRDYLSVSALKKLKQKFFIMRNLPEDLKPHVDIALPAAAWGEYCGTFTNFQGRVQRLEQAFEPLGVAQPVWKIIVNMASAMKKPIRWKTPDEVFRALARKVLFFKNINWDIIGSNSATVEGKAEEKIKATG